jgi:hypothetical protein
MTLIGIYFIGLKVAVGRSIYRYDSRTIKGAPGVSNFIKSFVESSNLFILIIIFLGFYLKFIHVRI